MKKFLAGIVFILFLASAQLPARALEYDMVYDDKLQKSMPIPACYMPERSIYFLGDEYGALSNPQDVFIDSEENLFIADTGNNRIVKTSNDGAFLKSFTVPDANTPLNAPSGVFVTKNGDVYIADTGNQRIAVLDKNGTFLKEYTKPDSEMLGSDFVFDPRKVAVTSTGNLYVLKQQWLMSISKDGEFRGFVGVTKVKPSLWATVRRLFMNEEQRKLAAKPEPPSCLSFELTAQDEVYVTSMDYASGQMKKLNLLGDDIYPKKTLFGEFLRDEQNQLVPEIFVDVAADKRGNIFLLDQKFAQVCVYDQQGNNLAIFDGAGYGQGKLSIPSAVTVDSSGRVFISDQQSGEVLIFAPTKFMSDLFNAAEAYNNGDYSQSVRLWENVAKTDENYALANQAIARSYYKNKQWKESMEYYRRADNKAGYSEAYGKMRHQVYKENFFIVVFLAALATASAIFGLLRFKKYSCRMLDNFGSQ